MEANGMLNSSASRLNKLCFTNQVDVIPRRFETILVWTNTIVSREKVFLKILWLKKITNNKRQISKK